MKKVFTSPNYSEVGLLAGVLEEEGIPSFIKNQHVSIALGSIPFLDCWPELWVNDDDNQRASTLIAQWEAAGRDGEDEAGMNDLE